MKDQINRYARGLFDYEPLTLVAKDNSIYAVVDRNQVYSGILSLATTDGREAKGVVFSSNDKVIPENPGFRAKEANIAYHIRTEDALPGEVIDGFFHVVSNGGELKIPYSFRIEAGSYESSIGTIRNLYQFSQLAQADADEAVRIFLAQDFAQVYLNDDPNLTNIYYGLTKGIDVRNNLEEFLIAAGKKSPIHLILSDNKRNYPNVRENFKDTVILERDTWGYLNVSVHCDAPFLRLERRNIDADSFSGNRYEFSYVVDFDKLHAGRNIACIRFEANATSASLQIVVEKEETATERRGVMSHKNKLEMRKLTLNLMDLYVHFRTHSIAVEDWVRESRIVLESMQTLDENSLFCKLAQAQLYITEQRDAQAKELMEDVKDDIQAETPQDYPLYCYFIYVNTLYNKEYAYSKRASVMIKDCFQRCDDWRILWTLLFIDEELETNPSLKLLRIKEQFNKGCHSPVMYIEACRILNEQPHLLRVMNGFEASVLYFGAKHGMIEEKLSSVAASMIIGIKYGTEKYIRLMWALYQGHPTTELLECLCRILVRNNCTNPSYTEIYGEAIRQQIKITQLFEFYVMSRRMDDWSPLPKMVLMYFGYNNSLDYQKKAYLYANIIYNKKDNPQAYRSYQPQMAEFVQEQMSLGHVNEHLCRVYEDVLTVDMVTEENAQAISEIFSTFLLKSDSTIKGLNHVVVRQKELDVEKQYPIIGDSALIRMYTEDAAVYLADEAGNRYYAEHRVTQKHLIEKDEILHRCLELRPDLLNLQLYYSEKSSKYHKNSMEAVEYRKSMLLQPGLNKFFRLKLQSAIIDYYYDSYDAESFKDFMENVAPETLPEQDFIRTVEIHITQGNYEHAFRMLLGHSGSQIAPKRLLKLCSRMVLSTNTENPQLVSLCYVAFEQGRYDEMTLQYLADYYNGPSTQMIEIWKSAREMELDCYRLEERIVAQMLFAQTKLPELEAVFEHYYAKGPKERIVEAYLAYFAYQYFVRCEAVSESVFELIEVCVENNRNLATICGMALIRYYSSLQDLTAFRRGLAEKIVYELARKDYVFPFMLKLQNRISLPVDIADKTMIEYRANPRSRVVIHYHVADKNSCSLQEYVKDMKQVYDGIFVMQFVLFYGESITYYITEERNGEELRTRPETISNNQVRPERTDGRYDAINDVIAAMESHDGDTVDRLIHAYASQNILVEQIFKPL